MRMLSQPPFHTVVACFLLYVLGCHYDSPGVRIDLDRHVGTDFARGP
jgi:hypothetical protein